MDALGGLPEEQWASAGEALGALNFSEKIIEEKERQLQASIERNYLRIREVEQELGGLQLQLRLTSGPKKSALELLRRKIETQNDRVLHARQHHQAVRKVAEEAEEALKREERLKEVLCQELNMLVQQSAYMQLDKLEQLMRRLEALNCNMGAGDVASSTQRLQAEIAQAASQVVAEAQTLHCKPSADSATPRAAGASAVLEHEGSSQQAAGQVPAPSSPPEQAPKAPAPPRLPRAPSSRSKSNPQQGKGPPGAVRLPATTVATPPVATDAQGRFRGFES